MECEYSGEDTKIFFKSTMEGNYLGRAKFEFLTTSLSGLGFFSVVVVGG